MSDSVIIVGDGSDGGTQSVTIVSAGSMETAVVAVPGLPPAAPPTGVGETATLLTTTPRPRNTFYAGPIDGDPDLANFRKLHTNDVRGIALDGGNF